MRGMQYMHDQKGDSMGNSELKGYGSCTAATCNAHACVGATGVHVGAAPGRVSVAAGYSRLGSMLVGSR